MSAMSAGCKRVLSRPLNRVEWTGSVPTGLRNGLSRMKGNFHVRFLGEGAAAMPLPYPTNWTDHGGGRTGRYCPTPLLPIPNRIRPTIKATTNIAIATSVKTILVAFVICRSLPWPDCYSSLHYPLFPFRFQRAKIDQRLLWRKRQSFLLSQEA